MAQVPVDRNNLEVDGGFCVDDVQQNTPSKTAVFLRDLFSGRLYFQMRLLSLVVAVGGIGFASNLVDRYVERIQQDTYQIGLEDDHYRKLLADSLQAINPLDYKLTPDPLTTRSILDLASLSTGDLLALYVSNYMKIVQNKLTPVDIKTMQILLHDALQRDSLQLSQVVFIAGVDRTQAVTVFDSDLYDFQHSVQKLFSTSHQPFYFSIPEYETPANQPFFVGVYVRDMVALQIIFDYILAPLGIDVVLDKKIDIYKSIVGTAKFRQILIVKKDEETIPKSVILMQKKLE